MPSSPPPPEVQERLLRIMESTADLMRLRKAAKFHAQSLRGVKPDDLVHDAFVRHLTGQRGWNEGKDPVAILLGTIQSIAWEWRKQDQRFVPESRLVSAEAEDGDQEEGFLDRQAAPGPDGAAVVSFDETLKQFEEMFADDENVRAIIRGRLRDLEPDEIQREYGMTPTQYASALKKIVRAINSGKLDEVRHG